MHYLYHQDYNDTFDMGHVPMDSDAIFEPPSWPLRVNAEMFAIAERLGMSDLKDLAMRKTKQVMLRRSWWKDIGRAVRVIYESTPPREQRIRQLYVEIFRRRRSSLLKRSDCEEIMADMVASPQFFIDVSWPDANVYEAIFNLHGQDSEYIRSLAGLPTTVLSIPM